jgi:predicted nuclease of predicted toxin-antitoxin system
LKILIDECVPRSIKRSLTGHIAHTVQELGYSSYENGDLISIAEGEFDLFITSDLNIRYQQNLTSRNLAILMLSTNKGSIIKANKERIFEAVNQMKPTEFRELFL